MCVTHYDLGWTCPSCQERARVAPCDYAHSSWTDGDQEIDYRLWRMRSFHEAPLVLRCPACSELDWLPGEDDLRYRDVPEGIPVVGNATEADCLEALEQRLYGSRDEKLQLRLRIWRAGNDPSREEGARAQIRSAAAQANLEGLFELLCEDTIESGTKAEVARQLGEFDECLRLISALPRLARAQEPIPTIARLAREGSDRLGPIEDGWVQVDRFTCPHCNQPGRLGESQRLNLPVGVQTLSADQVVRCGACRGWLWRGDHLRAEPTRLEWLEDGALGGLGCCLFFPLGFLLAGVSPSAALVMFGLFVATLTIQSAAGVLRPEFAPDSLPLTERDLLERIAAEDWTGPGEERWLRVSAWHLRRKRLRKAAQVEVRGKWVLRNWVSPSDREEDAPAQLNEAVLLESLGGDSSDLLLRTQIHRRAGEHDAARRVLAEIPEGDAWASYCVERLERQLRKAEA
ncbi:MAG: hypothetical protein JKY65_26940 [Planctomycetes bacterium]|nr:hypothetical protein [Planctomycetota bacterium]